MNRYYLQKPTGRNRLTTCVALAGIALLSACSQNQTPAELPVRQARLEPVLAQTAFGKSVAQAVRTSPQLSASAAEIAVAQAELFEAQSAAHPGITLGLDLAGSAALGHAFGARDSAVVQVSQLLFDGGATKRRVAAAEIGVQREAYLRDAAKAQITLNAAEVWVELRQQRQIYRLSVENEQTHRTFYADMQDVSQAGVGNQVDLLSAKSRLAPASSRKASAKNALDHATASYMQYFGAAPQRLPRVPSAPSLPAQPDDVLIKTSPRLQSLDAEIASATEIVGAAEASRQPPINFDAGLSYDPTLGDSAISVGVSPRLEVINGGRRRAIVAQAVARRAQLQQARPRKRPLPKPSKRLRHNSTSAARASPSFWMRSAICLRPPRA